MKKITSTVRHSVPHWNFCNIDVLDLNLKVPEKTCKFCIKDKNGAQCLLYNEDLSVKNGLISKTNACCKATASGQATVEPDNSGPTIKPKELMKQTIDLYTKTVEDLVNQGYPRQIANTAAKKHVLGD